MAEFYRVDRTRQPRQYVTAELARLMREAAEKRPESKFRSDGEEFRYDLPEVPGEHIVSAHVYPVSRTEVPASWLRRLETAGACTP